MRILLMPREATWWIWTVTVTLLGIGLAGWVPGFSLALAVSAGQCLWFALRERSLAAFPLQIRIAYTLMLASYLLLGVHWMFWIPFLGTSALVIFGYCLLARILSLLPWNRTLPFSWLLVRHTFLSAPAAGNPRHGLPPADGPGGVCTLERRVAELRLR